MRRTVTPLLLPFAALIISACAQSVAPPTAAPAPVATAEANAEITRDKQADRAAILAMAGDFEVTFDFIETVAFQPGYDLKDRKLSAGYESVRVIAAEEDFISLQHILVVGGEKPFPVKHWRQDWVYEPESVLTYVGGNAWEMRPVDPAERRGKWAQTVYQVDDSPRYGAVGAWLHEDGVSAWEPARAWRPLPRRDATTRDDYHTIAAVNRHVITAAGWVHEQDNSKLILTGENPKILAREIGINTYKRFSDYPVEVAETYWSKTAAYWQGVRAKWSELEAGGRFGLTVQGEPEAVYGPLLELASAMAEGQQSLDAATADARKIIEDYTTSAPGALAERLSASAATGTGDGSGQ